MEHELKEIRYQSAKYAKLTCLINRVNEETLKQAHQRQKTVEAWLRTRLAKPVARTMELISLSLAGHYNCYGVNGNFHAIQTFWKYVKYATYRMLNRRDQKGKFRYSKFLRVWNYYVKEPHLPTDILGWKPMLV